jgi:hypothetical protein
MPTLHAPSEEMTNEYHNILTTVASFFQPILQCFLSIYFVGITLLVEGSCTEIIEWNFSVYIY